jgi:hypothetical protein
MPPRIDPKTPAPPQARRCAARAVAARSRDLYARANGPHPGALALAALRALLAPARAERRRGNGRRS